MTPETTSSPPRPHLVPDEVQSTSSLVPPHRDEDEVDEVTKTKTNPARPGTKSTDRIEFPDMPPEPARLAWCEWLEFHTVDPNRVLVSPGWVERRVDERQIAYLTLDLAESPGRPFPPVFVTEVVQLEARPLPFPKEAQ